MLTEAIARKLTASDRGGRPLVVTLCVVMHSVQAQSWQCPAHESAQYAEKLFRCLCEGRAAGRRGAVYGYQLECTYGKYAGRRLCFAGLTGVLHLPKTLPYPTLNPKPKPARAVQAACCLLEQG